MCEFGDGIKAALNHGHGGVTCRRRDALLRPRTHSVGIVPNNGPGGGRAGLGFVDAAGPVLDGKEFDVSAAMHGDMRAQGVELTVIAGHREVVTIVVWYEGINGQRLREFRNHKRRDKVGVCGSTNATGYGNVGEMPGAPSGRHDGFAEAFELDGKFLVGGKQLGCGGVDERTVVQECANGARGGCDGGVDKRVEGTSARQVVSDGANAAESFDDVGDVSGGAADQHGVKTRESRKVEPGINDGS